jgi:hypothetical protein
MKSSLFLYEDLVKAAFLEAFLELDLCNQEPGGTGPLLPSAWRYVSKAAGLL